MAKATLNIPAGLEGQVHRYRVAADGAWLGPPHHHDELELNLVNAGQARVLVRGRSCTLEPGTLLWLLPGQSHILIDASRTFDMWVAVFRPALSRRLLGMSHPLIAPAADTPLDGLLYAPESQRLRDHLDDLNNGELPSAQFNVGLGWLLVQGWRSLLACAAHRPVEMAAVDVCVEAAARRLQADPTRWDLSALARAGGVSRPWLSRQFHRQIGVTLTEYRNRQRLRRLAQLAKAHPHRDMSNLAMRAGFRSYSQCYRTCRMLLGVVPSQLRGQETGR